MSGRSAALGVGLLTLGCLAACESSRAPEPQPAVLVEPSAATHAALAAAVGQALEGIPVQLAEDALTHQSELLIEPVRPRDAQGLPLQGREVRAPERFRLIEQGSRCILVHERTGRRFPLSPATCMPAPSA